MRLCAPIQSQLLIGGALALSCASPADPPDDSPGSARAQEAPALASPAPASTAPASTAEQLTDAERRLDPPPQALSPYSAATGGVTSFSFVDSKGVAYDALGRSVDGAPRLEPLASYRQFWFAWVAFNPGSQVFGQLGLTFQPPLDLEEECVVPCDEIIPGGPGKDGIPALTAPEMVPASSEAASYIDDSSFVVGFAPPPGSTEPARAYPHNLFWYHEIVNDVVFGTPVSVTHCPLTFSSLTYDPQSFNPGQQVELGVSGNLFQSNLVFYNRHDDTYFSQLLGVGLKGPLKGHRPDLVPSYEMTWGAWRALFPDSVVASEATGHARPYLSYPYGRSGYFTDDSNTWSTAVFDDRYGNKSITYGLRLGDQAKAYPESELVKVAQEERGEFAAPRGVINDVLGDQALVIVYDLEAAYFQVFAAEEGEQYSFAGASGASTAGTPQTLNETSAALSCGPDETCGSDEFCVVTRGAICMPLPPNGQQCPAECTPTEHCCNCPAFACVDTPAACDGSADCSCIDSAPALQYCQPERRICEGQGQSIDVTCVNVDFDENPFADDDPFAEAAAAE